MSHAKFERYDAYKDSEVEWLDEVPAQWEVRRIQDLTCKVGDGLHGTPNYVESSKFHFINGNNLVGGKIIISENTKCISEDEFTKHHRTIGNNAVLLSVNGTVGNLAFYNNESIVLGKSAAYISLKSKIERKYIYYFLQSIKVKNFFETTYAGTTIKNLSLKVIKTTGVLTPPLPEQQAIAAYLDTKTAQIDHKIGLLTQKATQYGKLKQSLINETVTRGLDKTVAMKDSGVEWIGEVPEHWDIYRIKDHTYVKGRIGWQGLRNSDFLYEGDFYCVTGTDLKNGAIDWSNCYYVPENRYEQDKFIQLKVNDLLITKDGTIGKVALVYELPKKSTLNSGVFVTRPFRGTYSNEYMYWLLCSSMFRNYIDLTKGGSTIQHLYQNVFERFSYPCPSLPEQRAIADYIGTKTSHIDRIIETINTQIDKLKELRKTLINDVVTGKIKVA